MADDQSSRRPLINGQSTDHDVGRREVDRRSTIVIFVASMLIPASFAVYSFYTGVDRTRTSMQEMFFILYSITVTVAILVSFATLVLYYLIPTPTPDSKRSLFWASCFTLISLITMMFSVMCAWLTILDDSHAYIVLSVAGVCGFGLLLLVCYSLL